MDENPSRFTRLTRAGHFVLWSCLVAAACSSGDEHESAGARQSGLLVGDAGNGVLEPCGAPPFVSFCTGNCSVCNHDVGRCEPNPAACLGDCATCTGSGSVYSCARNDALCDGSCERCEGATLGPGSSGSGGGFLDGSADSYNYFQCGRDETLCSGDCSACRWSLEGHRYDCAPVESSCPGTCSTCTGSGTQFSCVQECSPGSCQPCGPGKIKTCESGCWRSCVTGKCP
jgi:hypothetical protein